MPEEPAHQILEGRNVSGGQVSDPGELRQKAKAIGPIEAINEQGKLVDLNLIEAPNVLELRFEDNTAVHLLVTGKADDKIRAPQADLYAPTNQEYFGQPVLESGLVLGSTLGTNPRSVIKTDAIVSEMRVQMSFPVAKLGAMITDIPEEKRMRISISTQPVSAARIVRSQEAGLLADANTSDVGRNLEKFYQNNASSPMDVLTPVKYGSWREIAGDSVTEQQVQEAVFEMRDRYFIGPKIGDSSDRIITKHGLPIPEARTVGETVAYMLGRGSGEGPVRLRAAAYSYWAEKLDKAESQ